MFFIYTKTKQCIDSTLSLVYSRNVTFFAVDSYFEHKNYG